MSDHVLSQELDSLTQDSWRDAHPFATDIADASQDIWVAQSKASIAARLETWIRQHQQCLFGRIAAREQAIDICVIQENDVSVGDAHVGGLIQSGRLAWRQRAERGLTSNFIILVVSERISRAIPDAHMLRFSQRLASLYLLEDVIEPDKIYSETVALEVPTPGPRRTARYEWKAGVNYFCAQADQRWWNDHRLPGGMAFSINSVGHMVKSHAMASAYAAFHADLSADEIAAIPDQVADSLSAALVLAMKTIDRASPACSGKATRLIEMREATPGCPIDLKGPLASRDHLAYEAFYDTDQTLPSLYFRPDVERPAATEVLTLDFSYFTDSTVENADHRTMAAGLRTAARKKKPEPDDGGFKPA